MYKHVANVLFADIICLAVNNDVNEVESIESVLFPGDPGMFDYNKNTTIPLAERFLLFYNE